MEKQIDHSKYPSKVSHFGFCILNLFQTGEIGRTAFTLYFHFWVNNYLGVFLNFKMILIVAIELWYII